ncbi:MAG TPA: DHA2 family efflux MFS transporter permease subunit [Acidimicrobiia bacterium]|nr:DHA2 family efflux MFS transporter permease subunit [Acidimicrobiia bacterium]
MTEAVADPAHSARAYSRRWYILAVLCFCLLVVGIDNTILNVALPTLVKELGATASQLQWIVDAYTLVFASLLLTAGTMGDKFGRRRALVLGLLVFGGGSVASAFAGSAGNLIATRAVMGLGGALIMPSTLSILTNVFPPVERGRAIGIWAGVSGLGVAIGPLTGGFLLEHFWWGSVFLVNVPVVILALLGTWWIVPSSKDPSDPELDLVGTALSALGLFGVLYGIIEGPSKGWTSAPVLVAFGVGGALLVAFAFWELRSTHPMLDVRFFENPRFSAASLSVTFVFFAMFGSLYFLSLYLQFVLGYTPLQSGLRLMPVAVVLMVAAPTSSTLTRRFGTKAVVAAGLTTVAAGLFLLGQATPTSGYPLVLAALGLLGLGMGTAMAPATDSIMGSLPPERAGVGSAVNDTTREIGGALGVAILGSIAASQYSSSMAASPTLAKLPAPAVAAATNSIGGAVEVGVRLAGTPLAALAAPLVTAAKATFVDAMSRAVTIGAAAAVIGAIVAVVFLPARPLAAAGEPEQQLRPLVVTAARTLPAMPSSVFDATLRLLAEAGFSSLNFSGVATRAGVSTAVIEKTWRSKLDLVTSVVQQLQAQVPMPHTGSVHRDCEAYLTNVIRMLSEPRSAPVVANLIGEAGRDPALAAALRERLVTPRRLELVDMFEAARARGELRADADPELLADLIVAPVYYRLLVTGEPVDDALAARLTDTVLGPALAPA